MRVLAAALVVFAMVQKDAPAHVVTDAVTERSIASARVLFVRTEGRLAESVVVEADDRGRFSTTDLPVGTYRVVAEQDGYMRGSWPQPVSIMPGQTAGVISIALTPTAVITGRVLAEDGQPASRTLRQGACHHRCRA